MSSLEGKTVLITGASSGIGKAITRSCLDHGAQTIGLCRSIKKLPREVIALECDLSCPDQIVRAFGTLTHLDILVNNAGLAYLSQITTGDPTLWQKMWQINVHALSLCSQEALKLFPKGSGHILNCSSLSGHRVPPTGGFYAATKFAVRAITESLRCELSQSRSGVRVSSISPGFVDTPLLEDYFCGREDQLAQTKREIRMLTPENVAATVLHILTTPKGVEINDILIRSADQAV